MQVLLLGQHVPSWHQALGAEAPTWQAMRGQVRNHDPQAPTILLPMLEDDVERARELCRNHANYYALIPSPSIVSAWRDKLAFQEWVQRHALTSFTPRAYNLHNVRYPCVFKVPSLNNGRGIHIVQKESQLRDHVAAAPRHVLQEYIPGRTEYIAHCVARRGQLLLVLAYQNVYAQDYIVSSSDQPPLIRQRHHPGPVELSVFQAFLRAAQYDGPCCIDYRLTADGTIRILEINPRLGGSLMEKRHQDDLQQVLRTVLQTIDFPALSRCTQ
jgi:carbamoylphosphate synthase large subunit